MTIFGVGETRGVSRGTLMHGLLTRDYESVRDEGGPCLLLV